MMLPGGIDHRLRSRSRDLHLNVARQYECGVSTIEGRSKIEYQSRGRRLSSRHVRTEYRVSHRPRLNVIAGDEAIEKLFTHRDAQVRRTRQLRNGSLNRNPPDFVRRTQSRG